MIRWPSCLMVLALLGCGCKWLGLERDDFDAISHREIATPKVTPASVEAAARVDRIGRQLLAASPFLGIDPSFQTIGKSEPELFHSDSMGLFLTEGVVNLCRKDEELAAVLAYELGQMAAETRRTDRMRTRDPIPAVAMGGRVDGSTDMNISRDMYLAEFEKNVRKPTERKMFPVTDANKIARQILADAGYAEKWLDDVQTILKRINLTQTLAKQLGGRAAPPKWNE